MTYAMIVIRIRIKDIHMVLCTADTTVANTADGNMVVKWPCDLAKSSYFSLYVNVVIMLNVQYSCGLG